VDLLENPLVQRSVVSLPSPAAGQGFTRAISGADTWRVVTIAFRLVASNAPANRIPAVMFLDANGFAFVTVGAPFAQAATLTTDYTFGIGLQQFGAAGAAAVGGPLPDVELDRTTSIHLDIAAVQAADQVSRVRLFVEQHNERL